MQDIPEQEEICVLDGLRGEEVVCLNRDLAVCDRLGVVMIPVLRVTCEYMRSDFNVDVRVLTAMASSTTFGRS